MIQQRYFDEIAVSMSLLAEEKQKLYNQRVYPSKLQVIGVSTPRLKTLVQEFLPKFQSLGHAEKIEFLSKLQATTIFEVQQFALELITQDKPLFTQLTTDEILEFNPNNDCWFLIDAYAVNIIGKSWRLGMFNNSFVQQFLLKDDVLQKRISITACLVFKKDKLNQSFFDIELVPIFKMASNSDNRVIQKALSWVLRALVEHNEALIYDFMESNASKLSKKVRCEVYRKIETGRK